MSGRSINLGKRGSPATDRLWHSGPYHTADLLPLLPRLSQPGRSYFRTPHETTTSQQALFMMNSSFVMEQVLATWLGKDRYLLLAGASPAERIQRGTCTGLVYGRPPSPYAESLHSGTAVRGSGAPEPRIRGKGRPRRPLALWPWHLQRTARIASSSSILFPFFANGHWRGGQQGDRPVPGSLEACIRAAATPVVTASRAVILRLDCLRWRTVCCRLPASCQCR